MTTYDTLPDQEQRIVDHAARLGDADRQRTIRNWTALRDVAKGRPDDDLSTFELRDRQRYTKRLRALEEVLTSGNLPTSREQKSWRRRAG